MSGDVSRALSEISSSADHKTKTEKYKVLLNDLVKTKDVAQLRIFIDHSILNTPLMIIATENNEQKQENKT